MGAIGDILKRAASDEERAEDFSLIYHEIAQVEILKSGVYNGYSYQIYSAGEFPLISIELKDDTKLYNPDRIRTDTIFRHNNDELIECETFTTRQHPVLRYCFDKDGDYINEKQEGKQYTLSEVNRFAKHLIDLIIIAEREWEQSAIS